MEEPQVRAMSVAWAAAYVWRDRVGEWGQLLFASRGTLARLAPSGDLPGGRDLGYESASAFVAAFRRAMGTTPRRYFKQSAAADDEGEDPSPPPR